MTGSSLPAITPPETAPRVPTAARRAPALALRLSERKALLFASDMLASTAALLLVLHLRFQAPVSWATLARAPGWFVLLAGLWTAFALLLDAYDLRRASRVGSGAGVGMATALTTCAAYLLTPYITPPLHQSRLTAALFVGLMLGLVAAGRIGYARFLVQPSFRHRVLIVGAGQAGRALVQVVRLHAAREYEVIGFVDDDPGLQGADLDGVAVVGTSADLARLVEQLGVAEVVVAITRRDRLRPDLVQGLIDCRERGTEVTEMQAVYERLAGRVPVEYVGANLHVVLPVSHDRRRVYAAVKRGVDLVAGMVGLTLALLVLPAVALAIRLDSPGSIFYRQRRMGRGGRPFTLVKFRTMTTDAEAEGPQWAQVHDPRVTRVGRWLRRLHLDELPQAVNLLRGEMSLVGPRPERPEFVAELDRSIPYYRARHAVRPGVTGWAQVNHPYGSSIEDALVKLQYDLYYIKHCSAALDALILIRTLGLVLTLRGR